MLCLVLYILDTFGTTLWHYYRYFLKQLLTPYRPRSSQRLLFINFHEQISRKTIVYMTPKIKFNSKIKKKEKIAHIHSIFSSSYSILMVLRVAPPPRPHEPPPQWGNGDIDNWFEPNTLPAWVWHSARVPTRK